MLQDGVLELRTTVQIYKFSIDYIAHTIKLSYFKFKFVGVVIYSI